MASTPTAVLSLELQAQNDNTGAWWQNANQIFQSIEDAIAKEVALATTGGDTALSVASYSVDQSRCAIVRIGAGQTLTSLARITTARARLYFVTNETSAGAFNVQFGGNTSNLVTITRNCGAWVRVRSDSTTTFASSLINLTTGAIDGASLASGAFLLGANNLSDIANAGTTRTNLGLAIGTNVQAWDADLDTWATLTPSANAQSLVTAASYAAMRTLLGLVIGTNVQAWDADLDTWATLTPSANFQTLVTETFAQMRTSLSLAYAAQSDQETATSTTTVVAPGTQHFHPGMAKVAANVASDGTLNYGYNVASVTPDGSGRYVVAFTNGFSDTAKMVPHATVLENANTSLHAWCTIVSTTQVRVHVVDQSNTQAPHAFALVVFGDF